MAQRSASSFIADSLGLEFLNTGAKSAGTQVELLQSGAALLKWLQQAALIPPSLADHLTKGSLPGELDAVAGQSRALREWFRTFVYENKGHQLTAHMLHDLEPLNRLLARDNEFGQIIVRRDSTESKCKSAFTWQTSRRWRSPESLLMPIARSMASLLCNDDFTRVKSCEGVDCSLLFMDRTQRKARRWCSMALCGNRAKQMAHRERAFGRG